MCLFAVMVGILGVTRDILLTLRTRKYVSTKSVHFQNKVFHIDIAVFFLRVFL